MIEGIEKIEEILTFNEEELVEANESFIGDIILAIDNIVYKGITKIIDYFDAMNIAIEDIKYKTRTPNIKELAKISSEVNRAIIEGRIDKRKVMGRLTPVIPGLSATIPQVVDLLNKKQSEVLNSINVLNDFNNRLANISTTTPNNIIMYLPNRGDIAKIAKTADELAKQLTKLTGDKKITDRKPVRDVLPSLSIVPETTRTILKIGNVYRMENLEAIHESVEEITPILKSLLTNMKNINVDKRTILLLTDYIKELAKYITEVGFMFYLYYQIVDMYLAVLRVILAKSEPTGLIDAIVRSIRDTFGVVSNFNSTIKKIK